MESMFAVRAAEVFARSWAREDETGRARECGTAVGAVTDQAMIVIDARGLIRHCSTGAGEFLGSPSRSMCGRGLGEVLPGLPLRGETPGYNLAYLLMNHPPGAWHAGWVRAPGGEPRRVELSIALMHLGGQAWILMALREPPRPERQGHNHLERLIASLAASADVAVVTSPAGVIEYVNPAYEALTGYRLSEAVGQTQRIVKSGQHPPAFYQAMWRALSAGQSFRGIFANRAKSGRLFYVDQVIRPFLDRAGRITHYVATGQDVSQQVEAQRELQHRADFDGLTGLANRHVLRDRLNQEIARARRESGTFALACVDLDRFKLINDRRGHLAGDAALRVVAAHLAKAVREMDIVGRWGGDEFLLILPGLSEPMDVGAVLAKIVASVADLPEGLDLPSRITLSVGAAIFPADASEADELIHKADRAMYQAKLHGGNGYCAWDSRSTLASEGRPAEGAPRHARRKSAGRSHLSCVPGGARA